MDLTWSKVVLGIGNSGSEYAGTRHNVGFMVLDRVAERLGLSFSRLERKDATGARVFSGKAKSSVAFGSTDAGHFVLAQPKTYVNLSGDVAGPLLRVRELPPESLFVVVDDLNLPLGRIRVRPAGSAGGHNGLRSIEQVLSSNAYPRLRLGIGGPESTMVDHVLAAFSPNEREVLGPALESAADAVIGWLRGDSLETLMNLHNRTE